MAKTLLSQGASVTISLSATDGISLNSNKTGLAKIEAISGIGSGNYAILDTHPGGYGEYGPWGAGSVKLSAVGGDVSYEIGQTFNLNPNQGTPAIFSEDAAGNVTGLVGPDGGRLDLRNTMFPGADTIISKYGRTAQDICLATTTVGVTTASHVLSNERPRFSTYTRKTTISANTLSELRFPNLSITADPDDQSLSIDIYIEQPIGEFSEIIANPFIAVNLSNDTPLGSNYRQWGFGASYLRQGWNTLKMRAADIVGAVSSGNLPFGVSTTSAGTGCNFLSPIQYLAIQFTNMNGHVVHIDQVRRSTKAKTVCVIGFDASGSSSSDNIFVDTLAPLFASYGAKGYVTFTNVYELISAGSTSWQRLKTLQDNYGWDIVNHTWSHGAGEVGRSVTLTSLSRTSNLVTANFPSAHNITIGKRFRALINGATPSDMNGLFELTATTATQATYTASGANGSATGTLNLYTFLAQVLSSDTTENRNILRHELNDLSKAMRASGFGRAANVVAYPNNSVPELNLLQAVCDEGGINYGRSTRGGMVFVNEFGIDNPLHFGSWVMDSGTFATRTSTIIAKINAAIDRGEHIWIYGHYIQDEATAGGPVDLEYAPGQNGNPPPPGGALSGAGGWWYLGQLKRVFAEAILPAVASGSMTMATPSEWMTKISYGVGK